MDPNTAIKITDLSKQYRLGLVGTGTLSHDLKRWWTTNVQGKEDPYLKVGEVNDRASKGTSDYVWALKDINLEIAQGDVVGIIGKNGAGKSTLLKLLSRVTKPTTGTIAYRGRIASLLEVGTGFHPEMTGRENIYMNGAIMGMTRHEISRKLDEIIAFAGVERYIDTPVKRYSSGMTVRLGFAVAAHLEPDILIVDEVLAVGDAEFQKKAIGKMQDVSKQGGRTVLFVSHNMQAVSTLTNEALLLENGLISYAGRTNDVIKHYLTKKKSRNTYLSNRVENNKPFIKRIELKTSHKGNIHEHGEPLSIDFKIFTPHKIESPALSYQILNSQEVPILHILNLNEEIPFCQEKGTHILQSVIPNCMLYPGEYYLKVHFANKSTKEKFETIDSICSFEVKVFKEMRDYYWYEKHAVYVEKNKWNVIKL